MKEHHRGSRDSIFLWLLVLFLMFCGPCDGSKKRIEHLEGRIGKLRADITDLRKYREQGEAAKEREAQE